MIKKNKRKANKNKKNFSNSNTKRPKSILGIKSVSTNVKSIQSKTKIPEKIENKKQEESKKKFPKIDFLKKTNSQFKKTFQSTTNKKKNFFQKTKKPERKIIYKSEKPQNTICPFCNRIIKNMLTSLIDESTSKPIHFECALNSIRNKEKPIYNQRVVYIGQGSFAIIEDVRENGKNRFRIIEKFQYSKKITIK